MKGSNIMICECPNCGSNNIGMDKWGIFKGKDDYYNYCKDCDYTFPIEEEE